MVEPEAEFKHSSSSDLKLEPIAGPKLKPAT